MKKLYIMMFVLTMAIIGSVSAVAQDDDSIDHSEFKTYQECIDCHGTPAENAERTAHLGLWNPHNSIHGGYVTCLNCHEGDKLAKPYCSYCHEYQPDTGK